MNITAKNITAKYQGTTCKYTRAEKNKQVRCEGNPKIIHQYQENDIIGVSPQYHHYTFGEMGGEISGGLYIKVGEEIPDFIELHAPLINVNLKLDAMSLKIGGK